MEASFVSYRCNVLVSHSFELNYSLIDFVKQAAFVLSSVLLYE